MPSSGLIGLASNCFRGNEVPQNGIAHGITYGTSGSPSICKDKWRAVIWNLNIWKTLQFSRHPNIDVQTRKTYLKLKPNCSEIWRVWLPERIFRHVLEYTVIEIQVCERRFNQNAIASWKKSPIPDIFWRDSGQLGQVILAHSYSWILWASFCHLSPRTSTWNEPDPSPCTTFSFKTGWNFLRFNRAAPASSFGYLFYCPRARFNFEKTPFGVGRSGCFPLK